MGQDAMSAPKKDSNSRAAPAVRQSDVMDHIDAGVSKFPPQL
jgi:hypothetical protein